MIRSFVMISSCGLSYRVNRGLLVPPYDWWGMNEKIGICLASCLFNDCTIKPRKVEGVVLGLLAFLGLCLGDELLQLVVQIGQL